MRTGLLLLLLLTMTMPMMMLLLLEPAADNYYDMLLRDELPWQAPKNICVRT
jgi:hypothetical protein